MNLYPGSSNNNNKNNRYMPVNQFPPNNPAPTYLPPQQQQGGVYYVQQQPSAPYYPTILPSAPPSAPPQPLLMTTSTSATPNPLLYTQRINQQQQQPIQAFEIIDVHSLAADPNYTFPEDFSNARKDWSINLCQMGDCSLCCYSFFCFKCALADARTTLDGSNWYVNAVFLSPIFARWMIRTGYNIPGTPQEDCLLGAFLPCCIANQLLHTTNTYKTLPGNHGYQWNVNQRYDILRQRSPKNLVYDCCYALCCNRCAIGYIGQSIGLPFWLGTCCINVFELNSAIRSQHHYRPWNNNEMWLDCLLPTCTLLNDNTFHAAIWGYTAGLLAEENLKNGRECGYGLNPGPTLQYIWDYMTNGCVCMEPEGRYLSDNSAMNLQSV